ncbi:unnamed protein product, partial [Phaeothamnion confervicola]
MDPFRNLVKKIIAEEEQREQEPKLVHSRQKSTHLSGGMALATAGIGGAAGMVPANFGGSSLTMPHTFANNFSSMPQAPAAAAAGPQGAGGAFDLKSWDRKAGGAVVDDGPCLGIDVGNESCTACVWAPEDGGGRTMVVTEDAGMPTALLIDAKTGVKGLRRWLGKSGRAASLPKGVTIAGGNGGDGAGQKIKGLVRLLGLRQRGGSAAVAELSARAGELVAAADGAAEMDDTSALQVRVLSPAAKDEKDREFLCLAEDLLAVLITALKLKAEEKLGMEVRTCVAAVPACFTDRQRVCLQRAVFTAELTPRRY